MTTAQLDYAFPFIVLFYGSVMTFFLHSKIFMRLAQTRLTPALYQQLRGHQTLAVICLVVGSLWVLQNLLN